MDAEQPESAAHVYVLAVCAMRATISAIGPCRGVRPLPNALGPHGCHSRPWLLRMGIAARIRPTAVVYTGGRSSTRTQAALKGNSKIQLIFFKECT